MPDGDQHDVIDVVLVTGPGGSGKTTLAAVLAERLGWRAISEDDHWSRDRWGPGLRTLELACVRGADVRAGLVVDDDRSPDAIVEEWVIRRSPHRHPPL